MSGRIFQNVVLQLKENTDRTVGVIDGEGIVIACSELAMIGQRWAEHVPAINAAGGAIVTSEGKTFKALNGWGTQFDYAAFAFGDNEISKTVCAMATVALNAAKSYYEEKHDRGSFIKDIISDNIMLGDIYVRAKELRVTADVPRGVFVVRTLKKGESVPTDVIQSLFPDRQNDFVLSIGEGDVVLIRQMPEGSGVKELNKIASSIEEALRAGGEPTVVVGIGIGGNSEQCALLAKRALLRPLDEHNPDPLYREMEERLLERINKLGIGPQGLGGTVTALAVSILPAATHIAQLPICVNLCCHVCRHASAFL